MIATVAVIALVAGVTYLIAADHWRELRAWDDYLAAVREDAVNEAAFDYLDSDTPTHDALALERLRAGLEGWGK